MGFFLLAAACNNRAPATFYLSGPDFLKKQYARISIYNDITLMGSEIIYGLETNTFDLFPGLYRVKVVLGGNFIFWTNDLYFAGLGAPSPQEIAFPYPVTTLSVNQWKAGEFKTVSNGVNVEYQIYSFPIGSGVRTNYIYADGLYGSGTNTASISALMTSDESYSLDSVSVSGSYYASSPSSIVTTKGGMGYVLVRTYNPGTYAVKVSN